MRTGWSARSDPAAHLNVGADGPHTPGWAATCSAGEVETVGTDAGHAFAFDPPFRCHAIMHGAGKLGLASLCNLDRVPPTGAIVIAAPLKLVNGSGSAVRAIALVVGDSV